MEPRPNPDQVLSAHLEGETVLLHMDSKRYYRLNETGQRIWQLLEQRVPIADIAARLSAEFDVTEADAAAQVARFIDDLRTRELVSDDVPDSDAPAEP